LGRKGGGSGAGDGDNPTDVSVRSSDAASPSAMPSAAATEPIVECPFGAKEFVLKYSNRKDNNDRGGQRRRRRLENRHKQRFLTEFSTWYVNDVCTGDKIASCMPCASSSSRKSSSLSTTPAAVNDRSDHIFDRYLQNNEVIPNTPPILKKASRQCMPSDGAYLFVVESVESSDECCGFNATEYVVTFDNAVVAFAGENGNSIGTSSIEMKVLFGQSDDDTPCESNSPSEAQSAAPSSFPSASALPSAKPSMIATSMKPSVAVTNNPSHVSSEAPSISLSSSTPSSSPSSSLSSSPSMPPSTTSTMNPTLTPTTKSPTLSPTTRNLFEDDETNNDENSGVETPEVEQPSPITPSPTLRPTCNNDQDFNLCLAVDMSSSICISDGSCIGCPSDTCRDEFVTEATCCNNFAFIKGFASLMIRSLSSFPADKTFSIVQFATDGRMVSMMESHVEALSTIDQLYYTGGITNHAEAISLCRQSLSASIAFQHAESSSASSASATPRKSIMMLITDGVPTTPENDPEGAAMSEAIKAKEENGVFIIPVFISPRYDEDALSFMRGLSSDDKVFDVVDYESLDTLKDRLLEEVLCST